MKDMNEFLDKAVTESSLPSIIESRLSREYPTGDWAYSGDFLYYQDVLFLHVADNANRRMWWVRVDEEFDGYLAMTWDISEVPDLV